MILELVDSDVVSLTAYSGLFEGLKEGDGCLNERLVGCSELVFVK